MKAIHLVALIAGLPLLAGCFTCMTVEKAQSSRYVDLPDRVQHVERAVMNNEQIQIWVEAALSNSPDFGRYTLSFPLREMKVHTNWYGVHGHILIQRSAIEANWPEADDNSARIAIGPTVVIPKEKSIIDWIVAYKPSGETNAVLSELRYADPETSPTSIMKFVLVSPVASNRFLILETAVVKAPRGTYREMYWLIPFTVPLDIVTLPVQLVVACVGMVVFVTGGST